MPMTTGGDSSGGPYKHDSISKSQRGEASHPRNEWSRPEVRDIRTKGTSGKTYAQTETSPTAGPPGYTQLSSGPS